MSNLRPKGGWRAGLGRMVDRVAGPPSQSTPSLPRLASTVPHSPLPAPIALLPPTSSTQEAGSQLSRSPAPPSIAPPSPVPPTVALPLPTPSLSTPSLSDPPPPPKSRSVSSAATALNGLHGLLDVLQKGSEPFPLLQSAVGALVSALEAFEGSIKNKSEFSDLALELESLGESLDRHLQGSRTAAMSALITKTAKSIQEQADFLVERRSRGSLSRILNSQWDVETLTVCHQKTQALFRRHQIEAEGIICSMLEEQKADAQREREAIQLEGVKPATLATHDSSVATEINRRACTENTRIGVLSDLDAWLCDPKAPNICWMNGMAGTGKTTIAYTFAKALEKQDLLAASFFCTRTTDECRDVARIVPTIAYQLARHSAPFRSALCRVLDGDPHLASRTISMQFGRLLHGPLLEARDEIAKGLVVIIDALDECTANKGVEQVLELLLRAAPGLPLKFFVTSRPEPSIQGKIQDQPDESRSVFVLHNVIQSDVRADIERYLKEELPSLSPSQIKQLAELSGSLFIYAATAVRYIRAGEETGDFAEFLNDMLSVTSGPEEKHSEIDKLYMAILLAADERFLKKEVKYRMRVVLWTAVCAREPVSVETLAALAGVGSPTKALAMLQPLRSVLYVADDGTAVTTLHASFPDFVFAPSRSEGFFCDTHQHSQLLAQHCLGLMKRKLRFNICGLVSSDVPDDKVPELADRVTQAIPPDLAYSCRYWGDHLQLAAEFEGLYDLLREFLSERLLFWIEVMNLKHWMSSAVREILAVKLWLMAKRPSSELLRFSEDAINFMSRFAANPVSQSTPHLYVSSLAFCERSSAVYKQYWNRTRGLIAPGGKAIEHRDTTMLSSWEVGSPVYSVAYSPDGIQIAIGCDDGGVMIKDAYDGGLVAGPLKGHTGTVRSVTFSPDGTYVVSGSSDNTIRVWSVQDGNLTGVPLDGHTDAVYSVSFSPDGTRIVSGSADCTIQVWDVRGGGFIGAPLRGHAGPVHSVDFSPDGTTIVSGSEDCTVRIWNAWDGNQVGAPFEGHSNCVRSVAFSSDGTRIVSGSDDQTARVWDVRNGTPTQTFAGHRDWVRSVAFSPDGTRIITGSDDNTIRTWGAESGTLVEGPFKGHSGFVLSVAFAPDGARILSGSYDRTVRIWNPQGGKASHAPLEGHSAYVNSVAFSPDGTRLVSGSGDHTIRVWNLHDGTLVGAPLEGHTGSVNSVAVSPDGASIISGSDDRTVRVWNMRDGTPIRDPFEGHTGAIYSVAISPNGTLIASGSDDRSIRVWNIRDGTLPNTSFEGHIDFVRSVGFSPDGTRIVSGSDDRTVRVWVVQGGTLVGAPFEGHTDYVRAVAFSPDGTRIISGSDDRTIRVWNVQDGTIVGTPFEGHANYIMSVAFSPDGTHIVFGSADRTVRVWNVREGTSVGAPFEGHTGWVRSVAFSPDGTQIVSGSSDHTIRIWNMCSSSSVIDSWAPCADGWVVDQHSHLLFWVPHDFIQYMPSPYNPRVIGPNGAVSIDYRDILLGENWTRCYISE